MPLARGDKEGEKTTVVDFQKLESIRILAKQISHDQEASLNYFSYYPGYQHFRGKKKDISVSSSATCVLSLVATGKWKDVPRAKTLLKRITSKHKSAGLKNNNPFTIAWILDAVESLKSLPLSPDSIIRMRAAKMDVVLQEALKRGGASITPYPPSAYLTQLVVRVLERRSKLTARLRNAVQNWAWAELARQLALIQAKSKTQDAFAVAYLLMLATVVTPGAKISPEQTSIQHTSLETFFNCQLQDGTWPLSRPLFHYPNFGNAYCYEYEMLTQLLQCRELQVLLLGYLPNLIRAANALSQSVYRIEPGIQLWTSGHHPNQPEPESWTTASVYHFTHMLDRLAAEGVRRELFTFLERPLPTPTTPGKGKADFGKVFLDSTLRIDKKPRSLKNFLWENFVKPLADEAPGIAKGQIFGKRTPRSAIFFGPPGTSKTELSEAIAEYLGWSFLAIDPSFLLRNGMDGIQAEANSIFRRLEQAEGIVVLFDEFDELVRERATGGEAFSRFLTTAMLPKLASIHKRATLVFIIATNNIGDFDLAIRRRGRFDRVLQIMPPTFEAKMAKKDWGPTKLNVGEKLKSLGVKVSAEIEQQLGDLTFNEFEDFATRLSKEASAQGAFSLLSDLWSGCTLHTPVSKDDTQTWAERCKTEAIHNR